MALPSPDMWTALWGKLGGGDLRFTVTSICKVIVVAASELHCKQTTWTQWFALVVRHGPGLYTCTMNHK